MPDRLRLRFTAQRDEDRPYCFATGRSAVAPDAAADAASAIGWSVPEPRGAGATHAGVIRWVTSAPRNTPVLFTFTPIYQAIC